MNIGFKTTGLAWFTAILLTACGGGSGSPPTSSAAGSNITSGVASKGPLSGANVCAYAVSASASQGAQIGNCTSTDAVGNYSVNLGTYTGPVIFKAEGGTYADEATGKTVPLGMALRSVVANATGGPMTVAITALTELAYQTADAQVGRLSAANIQSATASVQNNFGIPDIMGTQPVDALKVPANATDAQKNYALALAGVSQYVNAQPGTSLASGLQTLQTCLVAPTISCGSGNTSVGALLGTALNTFIANNNAFAGSSGAAGRVASFGSVAAGANGANGANGTNGANGANGATGNTGAAGANGATGSTGAAGTNGTNGATGATGSTGAAGVNGTNGTNGATGSTGAAGVNGTNGTTGSAGVAGTNGATGAIGATGSTGAVGVNGTNGTNGTGLNKVNVSASSQQMAVNSTYLVNNAGQVTLTLPATANPGDLVQISGAGPGGWTIAQNALQTIQGSNLAVPLAAQNAGSRSWRSVASSSDGSKLVAVVSSGQIYTSVNSGVNWTARDSARNWNSVASSSDGSKLVAVIQGGQIYTSADSGLNWKARDSARNWNSVASSSDGSKLVAVVSSGQIYTSADSGLNWAARDLARSWSSVASSSDGSKLVAVVYADQIYTSVDSGLNWTPRDNARGWNSVASSSDGSKLVAVVSGGQIYTSADSGLNWAARDLARSWRTAASSSDGSKLVVVVDSGLIYTGSAAPGSTPGSTGSLRGAQYAGVTLQYVDNNVFVVQASNGTLVPQ